MRAILGVLLALNLYANGGDYQRGERLFYTQLADTIGLNGADFAYRLTIAEWEKLFENDGEGFIRALGDEYPALKRAIAKQSFIKALPDLKAFLILYAKDGGGGFVGGY